MFKRINFSHLLAPLAGLLALGGALALGSYGMRIDVFDFHGFIDEFYSNASTELFSIGVTVLVIDGLSRMRSRSDEKRRLILQMGSDDNTLAKEAVRILRLEGWLENGGLRKAGLRKANLQGAELRKANLRRVELAWANLREASLEFTDLRGAKLNGANLQGVSLFYTNLKEVDFTDANLQGARLLASEFHVRTTLPDGTRWTPDTDMARFTDPDHPDFWQGYHLVGKDLHDRDFRKANLRGAKLNGANLQGTMLEGANLEKAAFYSTNLEGASLVGANLQGATLVRTNLERACLDGADLQGAKLDGANLQGAKLDGANLQGATLRKANLQGTNLGEAIFDEKAVLPNQARWTPETDLARFTDPDHPEFWRPETRSGGHRPPGRSSD
jgi:uncharacterized protein YjbI with pentapeptide repeats